MVGAAGPQPVTNLFRGQRSDSVKRANTFYKTYSKLHFQISRYCQHTKTFSLIADTSPCFVFAK